MAKHNYTRDITVVGDRAAPIRAGNPLTCSGCGSVIQAWNAAWTYGAGLFIFDSRCANSGECLPDGQTWRPATDEERDAAVFEDEREIDAEQVERIVKRSVGQACTEFLEEVEGMTGMTGQEKVAAFAAMNARREGRKSEERREKGEKGGRGVYENFRPMDTQKIKRVSVGESPAVGDHFTVELEERKEMKIMAEQKQCSKCGMVKPLDAFCKNKQAKDGLSYWCMECQAKAARERNARKMAEKKAGGRSQDSGVRSQETAGRSPVSEVKDAPARCARKMAEKKTVIDVDATADEGRVVIELETVTIEDVLAAGVVLRRLPESERRALIELALPGVKI